MSYFRDVLPPPPPSEKGQGCRQTRRRGVKGREAIWELGTAETNSRRFGVRSRGRACLLKLDRLGRNTRDVLNLVHELRQKGGSHLEPKFATTDVADRHHEPRQSR